MMILWLRRTSHYRAVRCPLRSRRSRGAHRETRALLPCVWEDWRATRLVSSPDRVVRPDREARQPSSRPLFLQESYVPKPSQSDVRGGIEHFEHIRGHLVPETTHFSAPNEQPLRTVPRFHTELLLARLHVLERRLARHVLEQRDRAIEAGK